MSEKDIRWVQRLNRYQNALARLRDAVELASEQDLSCLERDGVIRRYKSTRELAWKVIADFFASVGHENLQGPRDAVRLAFQRGLITMGEELMESTEIGNSTAYAYKEEVAGKIFHNIVNKYHGAFDELENAMVKEKESRGL